MAAVPNPILDVKLTKSDVMTLRRSLALAHQHARRQVKRAQRNAATTVAGWAMEGADYKQLFDKLAEYVK